MEVFVLWLHLLVETPFGTYESYKLMPHPIQFETAHACEVAAENWKEDRLEELKNSSQYAVVYRCEAHSALTQHGTSFEGQTSML